LDAVTLTQGPRRDCEPVHRRHRNQTFRDGHHRVHDAPLILKRASASRSSGEWKENDYDVLAVGVVIGRILEEGSRFGSPELRWDWSIIAIVPATPATHGTAVTRDEAMAKFRDNRAKVMETRR
jgi:hypothetical protein